MAVATRRGTGSQRSSAATGERNQRELLRWTDRLGGWMTADLAARIIWPRSASITARKSAEALIRRTVKAGYLLVRHRSGGNNAGSIYVMTQAGAARVQGRSAEKWGIFDDEGTWTAEAKTFDHDLRTARLLIALRNRGHEIRTGDECQRRFAPSQRGAKVKIPDGLFRRIDQGSPGEWVWLETEGANKNSSEAPVLAEAVYKIAAGQTRGYARDAAERGEAIDLGGVALLLPPPDRLDSRGSRTDHRTRIRNAIRRAKADFRIWSDLERIGVWVYSETLDDAWLWHKERDVLDLGMFGKDQTQHQGWISGHAKPAEPDPEKEEAEDLAAIIAGPFAGEQAMKAIFDNIAGRPARERGRLEFERNDARHHANALRAELEAARKLTRKFEARLETALAPVANAEDRVKAAKYDADQANRRAAAAEQELKAAEASNSRLRTKLAEAEKELQRFRANPITRLLGK